MEQARAMRLADCRNIGDFRSLAKARLPWPVFDKIDAAADDESAKARNTAAFAESDLASGRVRGGAGDRSANLRLPTAQFSAMQHCMNRNGLILRLIRPWA